MNTRRVRGLLPMLAASVALLPAVQSSARRPATVGAPTRTDAGAHSRSAAGAVPDIPTGGRARHAPRARTADISSGGGPVLRANRTHLIFWQPAGSGLSFEPGYELLVERFLRQVSADSHLPSNIFGLTGQYAGSGARASYDSSYAGAIVDSDPLPRNGCTEPRGPAGGDGPGWAVCLSDQQLQDEITHVVAARELPTKTRDIYFLMTPYGFGNCFDRGPDECALGGLSNDGYCGYHQTTIDTGLLYAVIPYNAVQNHCQSNNPRPNSSVADPTISTLAHELAEVVTDPLGTSWINSNQNEIADLCITDYGPPLGGSSGAAAYDELIHGGRYFIQELWSNADGRCLPAARRDAVSFAAPPTTPGDRALALTGTALAAHDRIVSYSWSFGDRRVAAGRRVSHAYTRTGRYTVRLRTTDTWGNWASASRTLRVTVPRPPVTRIASSPARRTRGVSARLRFASDAVIASFQCRVDHRAWTRCSSPFALPSLARGGHAFSVRARDSFGQLGRAAGYRFTVA